MLLISLSHHIGLLAVIISLEGIGAVHWELTEVDRRVNIIQHLPQDYCRVNWPFCVPLNLAETSLSACFLPCLITLCCDNFHLIVTEKRRLVWISHVWLTYHLSDKSIRAGDDSEYQRRRSWQDKRQEQLFQKTPGSYISSIRKASFTRRDLTSSHKQLMHISSTT